MTTSNLGLSTVDSSDYISPDPFNANFEKIDALGKDYVTESGTSGEWWYRKWKSGRAECGIDYKQFAKTQFNLDSTGNLYMTPRMSFGAYPFSFASRPFVTISFEGDVSYSGRGSFCVQEHNNSTTTSPKFAIVDWMTGETTPVCGIYVNGRYK